MSQQSALPGCAGPDGSWVQNAGARGQREGPFRTRALTVLSLAGLLDTASAGDLELRVQKHAEAAHRLGQPLIVDLTHVTVLSGAAAAALDAATRHEEGVRVTAVTSDLHIRAMLALLSQVTLHPTIADAVAVLVDGPRTGEAAAGP